MEIAQNNQNDTPSNHNPETNLDNPDGFSDSSKPPAINQKNKTRHIVLLTLIILLIITVFSFIFVFLYNNYSHSNNKKNVVTINDQTNTKAPSATNDNVWKSSVNPASLPLGDGHVSSSPMVGYVDSCTTNFKANGASHSGSWINSSNNTWNSETKPSVEGSINWPSASYSVSTNGSYRTILTNDLPMNEPTGLFPISLTDPAYLYDHNPNSIVAQNIDYVLPLNPSASSVPNCTGLGPIGVLNDGVLLFNALDASGRDAVAHEIQDLCNGHPDGNNQYHYHDISICIMKQATGQSTLVGYALDGYGIYVERDKNGNLPTNSDLDACHGRVSAVMWNGKMTDIYHYDATLEYPYTIGCFHGTPINTTHNSNKPIHP